MRPLYQPCLCLLLLAGCQEHVELTRCRPTAEVCDGRDNDCDGVADNGIPITSTCGASLGECEWGYLRCREGEWECAGGVGPSPESCDGRDNDCDGEVDEDTEDFDPCYSGPPGSALKGPCRPGVTVCAEGRFVCWQEVLPSDEVCNGEDDDCDGEVDEDLSESDLVDVVFAVDRSGSMRPHMEGVRNAILGFLDSRGPGHSWWLIDVPGEGATKRWAPGSCHSGAVPMEPCGRGEFRAAVGALEADHGGFEPTYDAAFDAATSSVAWRDGSARYLVLFSDESAQSDRSLDELDVALALAEGTVTMVAFVHPAYAGMWDDAAEVRNLFGGKLDILADLEETVVRKCEDL